MPDIYLYAELLIHIRQLTLHASLQTEKNEHTKILLSFDKKVITALHEGETASIYLPTQISGTADITFPLQRQTDISTKLQIDDMHQLQQAIEASTVIEVPWTAPKLSKESSVFCKACKSQILKPDRITEWKDLPSENWADLMDLWFCHKPHEAQNDESRPAESRGFSAKSTLGVAPGVGLVDLLSFLVHPEDCSEVNIADQEQDQSKSLCCNQCNSFLGLVNEHEVGYRLWKSRVTLLRKPEATPESYDSAIFIAAQLLHLIESSIARKIVVHSNTNDGLLCWIFNPDIYYSSSKRGPTVHRAMKVFYKEVRDPLQMLDEHNSTLEELALPEQELVELKKTLKDSAQVLPQSARTFQDWQVGLLDRYEEQPSGQVAMDENALNHPGPREIQLFGRPEGWSELFM